MKLEMIHMTDNRRPIQEARKLYRQADIVQTGSMDPPDVIRDPFTGEETDVEKDVPARVVWTAASLGYSEDELDPDEDGPDDAA